MACTVYVDAGHGGYDNGAQFNGRKEKDDNLRLALAVGNILKENGVNAQFTRTEDIYQNPNLKAQIANEGGADLFVSIHRNSSPTPNMYHGVQTLIYNTGDVKEELANNINRNLEAVGFNNLGISVRPNLAVLRRTQMPAALVEAGFINSDIDNQIFDEKFYEMANAIATGILETLNQFDCAERGNNYSIQVGLFRIYDNAHLLQQRLQNEGYDARIERMGEYFAVLVGNYSNIAQANAVANALSARGYETLVISS